MDGYPPPVAIAELDRRSARFHTTRWSDVLKAAEARTAAGEEALSELCAAYWYPLYVRGCGFSAEDAQDLTQGFFARVVENRFLQGADRERGRFRWYLLRSLQNYLRNEMERARAQKRGGGATRVSWDGLEAEQRFRAEPVDTASPDILFDRRWARETLGRAMNRLSEEYEAAGRERLFARLKGYLAGNHGEESYAEAAAGLGLSTAAVRVMVHRLRHRYRELVRWEVAQTVADAREVDDEMRHLAELLAG
jgi:RNA polymerase sigma factor (sigma-70 family)